LNLDHAIVVTWSP